MICVPTHTHPLNVCVCVFQEFHYHPRGSDTCLPCDCYPVGSFSRSCDPETGQCQCRPGVIGRQCNSCDNPFAEVTNSGCEGENAKIKLLDVMYHSVAFLLITLVDSTGDCISYVFIHRHAQCYISDARQIGFLKNLEKSSTTLLHCALSKITLICLMRVT